MQTRKVDMSKIQKFAQNYRENQENFERNRNQGSNLPWYEWKDKNLLRLLPPWNDDNLLALPVYQHYRLQPSGKNCQCFRRTWGLPCYVCTAYGRIWKSNPNIKWQWRNRAYANGLDRYDVDLGVQIIPIPIGVYNWVMIQMAPDPDEIAAGAEPIGDITNPLKGCDLRVLRTKVGPEDYNISYSSTFISQGKPLHQDQEVADKLLGDIFDLYNIFKKPGQKKIEENIEFARALLHDLGLSASIGPGQLLDDDKYIVGGGKSQEATPPAAAAQQSQRPAPAAAATTASSSSAAGDKPECYGDYQDGEDKCLICAFETECMDAKGGSPESDDIPF